MVQYIAKDSKNGCYPVFSYFEIYTVNITHFIKVAGQHAQRGMTRK